MPACEAFSPSDTWAYTLAKKKNGTNTTDISPSISGLGREAAVAEDLQA